MRSLRLRLVLAFIAVALVAVALIALLASRSSTTRFSYYVNRCGLTSTARLQRMLALYYTEHGGWRGVEELITPWGQSLGARIILAGNDGTVLADSAGHEGRLSSAEMGAAVPIYAGGAQIGLLYIGSAPESAELNRSFNREINRSLIWAGLGAGLVAVLLGLLISGRITAPVRRLTAAARGMARGDLGQRVEVKDRDELGELGRAFNEMATNLEKNERLRRNMVADVAHELRTPLATLFGYLEALRDGTVEPNSQIIDMLYNEAHLLRRLVTDLQELALAEAGRLKLQREPVAIDKLITEALRAIQDQAKAKGIELQVELPPGLPPVNVDRGRIAQVLRNLLDNAVRHTPNGGRITVAAKHSGNELEISVSDTGPGVSPEDLPYIFERFYRADRSRARATGGAGLGLTIAKRLIEVHGGRIWAESCPGQGATFVFTLPQD